MGNRLGLYYYICIFLCKAILGQMSSKFFLNEFDLNEYFFKCFIRHLEQKYAIFRNCPQGLHFLILFTYIGEFCFHVAYL